MTPADFKAFRLANDLTQPEMARLLGVHVDTVKAWERDEHRIPRRVELLLPRLRTGEINRQRKQTAREQLYRRGPRKENHDG